MQLMIRIVLVDRNMASNELKRKSNTNSSGSAPKKAFGHWSMGLKASMEDPELRVDADDQIIIIKDKYPKARFHFLVLPKENISSLKKLEKDHLPLLRHMQQKGRELAEKSSKELRFRLGYHAIPSMSHIHLHVISQDFDSPCLKTKKHWNSFTSEYFVNSKDLIEMLETNGKIEIDTSKYEALLKRSLRCHVCEMDFSTMPALKQHIIVHVPKTTN